MFDATKTRETARQHDLVTDDELLPAKIVDLDTNGAIAKTGFEIVLPQVGGFEYMHVAVDDQRLVIHHGFSH